MIMDLNISSVNEFTAFFTASDSLGSYKWHVGLVILGKWLMTRIGICNHTKLMLPTYEQFEGKVNKKESAVVYFLLQLVHSNICGSISMTTRYEGIYFITFIDDFFQ